MRGGPERSATGAYAGVDNAEDVLTERPGRPWTPYPGTDAEQTPTGPAEDPRTAGSRAEPGEQPWEGAEGFGISSERTQRTAQGIENTGTTGEVRSEGTSGSEPTYTDRDTAVAMQAEQAEPHPERAWQQQVADAAPQRDEPQAELDDGTPSDGG